MAGRGSILNFGIVGCGSVVEDLHLPAWRLVPDARLVAICDINPVALDAVCRIHGDVHRYEDLDEFLNDSENIDFAVLATPGFMHVPFGEKILRRKIHLLCEKPLALDLEGAEGLYRIAEEEGVFLTPIHNYRYRDTVQAALAKEVKKSLGDVASVSVRFRTGSLLQEPSEWMRNERQSRTLLFDLAYHFVDLALLFLGPLSSLRFVDAELDSMGLQNVVVSTAHQYGARGNFDLMLDASCQATEIEILGESRGLSLQFFPDGFRMLPSRDTPVHKGIGEARRFASFAKNRLRQIFPKGVSHRVIPHSRIFQAFVDSLRKGGPNPVDMGGVLETISLLSEIAANVYATEPLPIEKMS